MKKRKRGNPGNHGVFIYLQPLADLCVCVCVCRTLSGCVTLPWLVLIGTYGFFFFVGQIRKLIIHFSHYLSKEFILLFFA